MQKHHVKNNIQNTNKEKKQTEKVTRKFNNSSNEMFNCWKQASFPATSENQRVKFFDFLEAHNLYLAMNSIFAYKLFLWHCLHLLIWS